MKRFLRSVSVAALLWTITGSAMAACGYSGATYVRSYDWTDDAAAAVPITASRMDEEDDCVAAALSAVVKRNGDSAMTGNLPMGSNRITSLADGTAATDAANVNQVQINIEGAVAAGGTVDAITATYSPALTALEDKMIVRVIAAGANTSATPSFTPNGLTTRTIVKHGGQALIAGDIAGAEHVLLLQYDLGNTRWELLNPAWGSDTTAFMTTVLDDTTAANARTTLDAQEDIMTTRGDLVTRDASATTRVAIGAANRFLQSDGTDFAWGQVDLAASDVTGVLPSANMTDASDTTDGAIEIAIQSEQETGTDTVRAVTPGRQQFHDSSAKAWCVFDGTAAPPISCADAYNVTNVGSPAAGRFEINFTTAFSSANYGCIAISSQGSTLKDSAGTQTASLFPLRTQNLSGTGTDADWVMVTCYGDQ